MTSEELVSKIVPGLTVDEALAAFVAACNRRDTLFITEAWFSPHAERLRRGLSNPITEDEAHALRELVRERASFGEVFDWLGYRSMSWTEYVEWRAAEAKRSADLLMERGIFPWEDVEAARADAQLQERARRDTPFPQTGACPRCGEPLTWVYFSSPAWTWEALCGRAGWLGLCDRCHLQVDFVLTMMN